MHRNNEPPICKRRQLTPSRPEWLRPLFYTLPVSVRDAIGGVHTAPSRLPASAFHGLVSRLAARQVKVRTINAVSRTAALLAAALLLGSLPAHAAFDGPCFVTPVNGPGQDDDDDDEDIVIVITGV
jgi:hypothetical protein